MLVTLPEETPVNEVVETAFTLEDRVGVKLAPVVVNGLYPPLDGLDADPTAAAAAGRACALAAAEADALRRAAAFRRDRQRAAGRAAATGWPTRCRCPSCTCRSCSPPTWARPRSTCWPTRLAAEIGELARRRRAGRRDATGSAVDLAAELADGAGDRHLLRLRAASARRRPRPPSPSRRARRGRRACVVTIDPAKRLADALGLDVADQPARPGRRATGARASCGP